MVPYRNYAGSDGKFFFAACFTDKFWQNLCHTIGRPDLLSNDMFKDNIARTANRHVLDGILEQEFLKKTADEWVTTLTAADVPAARVQDYYTALTSDPQIQHIGAVIEMNHPLAGTMTNLANPVRLSRTPAAYRRPPPLLGQHTDELLAEFGFSPGEIRELADSNTALPAKRKP
jgi:formyl-CoA transferase